MELTSKQKYNRSEKGKAKNREYQKKQRANPKNRYRNRLIHWKQRGLKYYPDNLNEEYEKEQNCEFCNKLLNINFMEHNHISGSFRGFTCSSCNTKLGNTDKYFIMSMNELKFIFNLPKIFKLINQV